MTRVPSGLLLAFVLLASPLLVAADGVPQAAGAQSSAPAAPRIVGTMSELMINLIYPTSDAILYITTRTPTNDVEWNELSAKALMLAESANLLMMPGRARDQDRWMQDARLMLDAGTAAFRAAKARNVEALADLNDAVYTSCTTCHMHYRQSYGRGRAATPAPAAPPGSAPAPATPPGSTPATPGSAPAPASPPAR